MSDLFKTSLQEEGRASAIGLSVATVYADVIELGIDPRDAKLSGGSVVVVLRNQISHSHVGPPRVGTCACAHFDTAHRRVEGSDRFACIYCGCQDYSRASHSHSQEREA